MKPYVSLFNQNSRNRKSIITRHNRFLDGRKTKPIIPPKYVSIKETKEKISKPITTQQIFIFNIVNGENTGEIL